MRGVILSGVGGLYIARAEDGARYPLRAQSKLRHKRLRPMVGDEVQFTPGRGTEDGWLEAILPRRNELVRPPVANIDVLCAVIAAVAPQPDLLLVDRLLVFARMRGIRPVVAVNKCDQDGGAAQTLLAQYAQAGVERFAVSATTGEGLEELRAGLRGTVHALCGQSGVGKSSLLNALYGFAEETGEISARIERGRNTTRSCSLIPVPGGGMALDTPGFSLLELPLMEPESIRQFMPELVPYEGKCRFVGCVHLYEPDCPARAAVAAGAICPERMDRYRILYEDMRARWRERYD